MTTLLAGVCCVVLAVARSDFSGLDWGDTWPFFVTGLGSKASYGTERAMSGMNS